MKKIIYIGMNNTPFEVFETRYIKNFKACYNYYSKNGKKVMLKATEDNIAHYLPNNYMQYPNYTLPKCIKNKLYNIDILSKGYSCHYFEIVEI